eukprot:CAMPEP_0197317116 /NCGR_PEP_ID=MMETSP0891-20130614/45742_1 /TAXON_ID=44058 ORGANISM="Aureoumbra lagunensis, Strain CCMP1510" /NCGR_SAMPLE_ID=MMETSP0891 /ASSEMBLY_ACC=CAM_ASM_000534 /LENGTH=529 /DNA_ID=CAMNT_0042806943 /DNA_START=1 /DNA_END=1590 /DNA_ORIENTATION=+
MKLRVKHGVMREDNKVYEILRRNPPPVKPAERELKEIKFPWEDLEEKRAKRMEEEGKVPHVPYDKWAEDPTIEFAQRQYKRMTKLGEEEEEAYKKVEAEYEKERLEAIEEIRKIRSACRRWHRGEREAPFLQFAQGNMKTAREKLNGWTELSMRLDKKPWPRWTISEKVDLDSWLVSSILGWRWQLERVFDDEASFLDTWKENASTERVALALEFANLRRDMFWPKLIDQHAGRVDHDVDDALDRFMPKEFQVATDIDGLDTHYEIDEEFERIQNRAEEKPLDQWTKDEVEEMDTYLKTKLADPRTGKDGLFVIDPSGSIIIHPDLPIERLRLEVFPELCPTYQRITSSSIPPTTATEPSSLDGSQDHIDTTTAPLQTNKSQQKEKENQVEPQLFDASNHATYDPDGNRVVRVQTASTPRQIARTLFKAGIFPEVNIDQLLERDANAPTDEDKILPESIADVLRQAKQADSYQMARLRAMRKAIKNDIFFDRINRKIQNNDPVYQWELKNNTQEEKDNEEEIKGSSNPQ